MELRRSVPLAPLTTLEVGGQAELFVEAGTDDDAREALAFARLEGLPVTVLGGGSNVIVSDAGIPGLVLRMATRGVRRAADAGPGVLDVAAGEPWDPFVARAVVEGLQGIECLSGIPGSVGATPIQNVGAYGQEVSSVIAQVEATHLATGEDVVLTADDCRFAYRHSRFKEERGQWLVRHVRFALHAGRAPHVAYKELERALSGVASPDLAAVRDTVIALRRQKSMVWDRTDANHRSVGSFFTNPVLAEPEARALVARAVADGLASRAEDVPAYPGGEGEGGAPRVKLAAGWLIERAGIEKGFRLGAFGVSTKHALQLVHHGGGTARELRALAEHVRAAVQRRFGVRLAYEPEFLGVPDADEARVP